MRLLHFLVGQNLLQGPGQEHVLRLLPLIHGRREGGGGSSDPRIPAAGGEEDDDEGEEEPRERRGGGGGGEEEAWRAAAGSGRGGGAGPAAGRARGAQVVAVPQRAAPVGPPLLPARGSLPGHHHHHHLPPHSPLRPGDGEGAQPGGRQAGGPRNEAADQRPGESRAALAPVGTSTRLGRGLASITADLPRPPCWEETTRHAAAERLQRRKRRRRRRWLPRAAAAPGGRGRRAAREERLEPQRYGGLAGPRCLPRSPAGRCGAWRASCGAALGASGSDDPRRRRSRRADAAPGSAAGASPTFQSPRGWAGARAAPSALGLTETPSGPEPDSTRSTCRVAGARRHCFHLPLSTLKFNYQPQETARSKTVSPDYLRILSWEEYNRSDEDARMFHFFISVG